MHVFGKEVMEKVTEIDEEKRKTEKALHDFLPISVVRNMRTQSGNGTTDMMAESFDCITILYGEVVGFDELICDCSAKEVDRRAQSSFNLIWQVFNFVNLFDTMLDTHTQNYKVAAWPVPVPAPRSTISTPSMMTSCWSPGCPSELVCRPCPWPPTTPAQATATWPRSP
jgi:hypothetical protein